MSWRGRACCALLALGVLACPRDPPAAPDYSELPVGAPGARRPLAPLTAPVGRDGGWAPRAIEQNLPEEATKQFATLAEMERSPRWRDFAALLRSQVQPLYARPAAAKSKPPHDISITQYFIRGMPEIYGVGYVAWCGAEQGGPLSYVENHLLVARQGPALALLTAHTPACGSVGERSVYFSDLIADGKDELIEVYVEDTAVGDDVQEIRVFTQSEKGLRRVAVLRVSSPVKYFHHEFRHTEQADRDIVTTHIEIEKVLARLRQRPCWRYRYFEVETTYRYQPAAREFVPRGTVRRRISQNAALDLTGSEAPEGSCGG